MGNIIPSDYETKNVRKQAKGQGLHIPKMCSDLPMRIKIRKMEILINGSISPGG